MEEENLQNDRVSSSIDPSNLNRERSTSDPCIRKENLVMNGSGKMEKRGRNGLASTLARDVVGTPPPVRKNKFASSISKLFRPWKWRKRKKSEGFITTSQNLERQLSVRAKREELVDKGILPNNNVEEGYAATTVATSAVVADTVVAVTNAIDAAAVTVATAIAIATAVGAAAVVAVAAAAVATDRRVHSNGTIIVEEEAPVREAPAVAPKPIRNNNKKVVGILKSSRKEEKTEQEIMVKQVDQGNMMDQLAREFAKRGIKENKPSNANVTTENGFTNAADSNRRIILTVKSIGNHASEDSDSDEEHNRNEPHRLASKLKRSDSLDIKLKARPSKKDLEDKNILPTKTEEEIHERRAAVGSKLVRRLSTRPTVIELRERNILKIGTEEEVKEEREMKKRVLTRKLSRRPTIQELKAKKIIKFSEYVDCLECHDYDRRS
ncbi:hypothetical protein QZH41_019165, partial [Actinostola sp. cb2023]